MRLELSCTLPARMARLMAELARPGLLQQISAPMLVFDPLEPLPERWPLGEHRFRLRVAGMVPIGEHTINAVGVVSDPAGRPADGVVWHDAGFSPLIRSWDHRIRLVALSGGGTRYTDLVDVRAGLLTVPAWLFARAFYGHRQRVLRRLALGWRSDPLSPAPSPENA